MHLSKPSCWHNDEFCRAGKQFRFPKVSSGTFIWSNSGFTRSFVRSVCFLCKLTRPAQVNKQHFKHGQCLLDVKQQNTAHCGSLFNSLLTRTYLPTPLFPHITQLVNNKCVSHLLILHFQFPKHAFSLC